MMPPISQMAVVHSTFSLQKYSIIHISHWVKPPCAEISSNRPCSATSKSNAKHHAESQESLVQRRKKNSHLRSLKSTKATQAKRKKTHSHSVPLSSVEFCIWLWINGIIFRLVYIIASPMPLPSFIKHSLAALQFFRDRLPIAVLPFIVLRRFFSFQNKNFETLQSRPPSESVYCYWTIPSCLIGNVN